jgi:tol-pal system protein YbgF
MQMNTRNLMTFSFTSAVAIFVFTGCGTTKMALEETITNLEREISRINTERVNLNARSTVLDDQVIVLEKRLEKCETGSRSDQPRLKVVRISREDTEEEQLDPATITRFAKEDDIKDGKRPVLTIKQSPSWSPASTSSSTSNRPRTTPSSTGVFANLAQDNLGVVKGGAQPVVSGDPMQAFQDAYRAYSNRKYDEALSGFSAFLQANPNHGYADNAMFWRGESYLAQGKFFKAVGELERLIKRYSNSDKVASGLYRIGFAYDKLNDRRKAIEYYFRVVDSHPGSDAARRASKRVTVLQGKGRPVGKLVSTAATR